MPLAIYPKSFINTAVTVFPYRCHGNKKCCNTAIHTQPKTNTMTAGAAAIRFIVYVQQRQYSTWCQKSHHQQLQAQISGSHRQRRKPTKAPGSRASASSCTSTVSASHSPTKQTQNTEHVGCNNTDY